MNDELFIDKLSVIDYAASHDKEEIIDQLAELASQYNYPVTSTVTDQPWGGYLQFDALDTQRFVEEFFPEVDTTNVQLGSDLRLVIVAPGERLDLQYHQFRTKHWKFLTSGKYFSSQTDLPGIAQIAVVGTSLQIDSGQRHQLVGMPGAYMVVAEIWQHTDSAQPSGDDDVVIVEQAAS